VAHDVQIGDRVILVNNAGAAGHCVIEDDVIIGGLVGVHQWVRIGRGAIIGALTMVTNDVIPYGLVQARAGEARRSEPCRAQAARCGALRYRRLRAAFEMLGRARARSRSAPWPGRDRQAYVREIVGFVTGQSDRSFLTPVL
jgi:UDP-N-acetylglucosamine acyltransferase